MAKTLDRSNAYEYYSSSSTPKAELPASPDRCTLLLPSLSAFDITWGIKGGSALLAADGGAPAEQGSRPGLQIIYIPPADSSAAHMEAQATSQHSNADRWNP